jgi:hypothetical protein
VEGNRISAGDGSAGVGAGHFGIARRKNQSRMYLIRTGKLTKMDSFLRIVHGHAGKGGFFRAMRMPSQHVARRLAAATARTINVSTKNALATPLAQLVATDTNFR